MYNNFAELVKKKQILSLTCFNYFSDSPDVKVKYNISKNNITVYCSAEGNPNNYTFYDWEHKSEFNEHIRRIRGTPGGQLIIDNSQNSRENENDGIYVCTVSNGVPNQSGKLNQKGKIGIKSRGSNQ